jgi:two-component system, chemotaxis family, sensor kinase CheA
MDAVLKEFLAESGENLDLFERDLVDLETRPDSEATLAAAFRAIHSIKGATGFLELSRLGDLAHAGESLLSALRERRVDLSQTITNVLLELVDGVRQMLAEIERTGTDTAVDRSGLIERLESLQNPQPETIAASALPGPGLVRPAPFTPSATPMLDSLAQPTRSVRVNVSQLDTLMNLVGELVLTRNEMLQHSELLQSPVFVNSAQRLNTITTQLQDGIMQTRMQPVDNVWSTFPRIVRDIALACGKQVRLELIGKETELDKTLLEAIKDPLTHIVRNCVDHGIETPARRLAAGKPAEGCVSLRAFHEASQVHIEVRDDGAGIDLGAIKQKAIERGLITIEQAETLSDAETVRLIFLPGFSTARSITTVSGRGVGMDVVKTNIERIGGRVTVHSEHGEGTVLKMRIPLTLAIMPGLVVTAGGDRFAIPQVGVLELLQLVEGDSDVQMMGDAPVLRLRGDVLPLVALDATLGMGGRPVGAAGWLGSGCVVVLQAEDRKFGLVVDDVLDTQEIVVKPLDHRIKGMSTFAGATIMGDGCVALILDVTGLAVQARVLSEPRRANGRSMPMPFEDTSDITETLLAVIGDHDAQMAIPLSQVTRLEEFHSSSIEHLGDREVVQCRNELLPLADVSELLAGRAAHPRTGPSGRTGTLSAVVYSSGGVQVGVVVRRILDIVEHRVADQKQGGRKGVRASAVIHGRVTEILDLDTLCATATSHLLQNQRLREVAV